MSWMPQQELYEYMLRILYRYHKFKKSIEANSEKSYMIFILPSDLRALVYVLDATIETYEYMHIIFNRLHKF